LYDIDSSYFGQNTSFGALPVQFVSLFFFGGVEATAIDAHPYHDFSAASVISSPDSMSRGGVSVVGIPSVQDYFAAETALPSPQDYYAAAMALFGIIIFAKFASHTRARTFPRGFPAFLSHWACVGSAAFGAGLCFFALGWAPGDRSWLRWGVVVTALLSGFILAVEVGFHGLKRGLRGLGGRRRKRIPT
jgi:hypothetical protein